VSVFQLEEDAIVRPSVLLEDLDEFPHTVIGPAKDLASASEQRTAAARVDNASLPATSIWSAPRKRPAADDPRFHGKTDPPPSRVLSVTKIDRYLDCPFKFFSSVVLGLEEEEDREPVTLGPRRRGRLVHEVFQSFFGAWAASGNGAVTPAALPAARALFSSITERALEGLAELDRPIERVRLLGSAAAPGLGERVFRLEALRPQPIVERLLEFDLGGTYVLGAATGQGRTVTLRGVADRIDLLADGTMRVIDYKTGRAPSPNRSLQLATYVLCAEQKLEGYRGRHWRVGEAAYIALADRRPWVPVVRHVEDREPIDEGRERLAAALDDIHAGIFPPSPRDRRLCRVCAFAAVCRKDYVVGVG
jgi:RecB family exonuclease